MPPLSRKMKPPRKHLKSAGVPQPVDAAPTPPDEPADRPTVPAATDNLAGPQIRILVHANESHVKVGFDNEHSLEYVFWFPEPTESGPAPLATLVANIIGEIWKIAFEAGIMNTRKRIHEAFGKHSEPRPSNSQDAFPL